MTESKAANKRAKDQNLFRQKVIDRLRSPEQMDLLMTITDRKSWFALIGFSIVVVITVIWAFLGTIPKTVNAQGILLNRGGVFTLQATSSGTVQDVVVEVGELVKMGQVIAKISQGDLAREIKILEQQINGLTRRHEQLKNYGAASQILEDEKAQKERDLAEAAIQSAIQQISLLQERLKSEQKLFDKGLITKAQLDRTRQELQIQEQEQIRQQTRLKGIAVDKLQVTANQEREFIASEEMIRDANKRLDTMRAQFDKSSHVTSPETGIVTELRVNKGAEISQGMAILNLELDRGSQANLETIIYVPASEGKKIQAGMKVFLEPSTVKSQEWGFLLAEVFEVGKFPVSAEAMQRILGNQSLVQMFLQSSPASIAVKARLLKNPNSFSGLQWTTGTGPNLSINAGTMCHAKINIQEQAPITLLFPMRYVREFKSNFEASPDTKGAAE